MNPATLALLDRRLARILKEHGWSLSGALSQALATLHVSRTATISNAFDRFRSASTEAQREYGRKLADEIALVVHETQLSLDPEGKSQVLEIVARYLNDALYAKRFSQLEEAIDRHFGRAGIKVDLAPFRPDMPRSLYDVDSKNFVIAATAKLADDLELVVQRPQPVSPAPPPDELPKASESKLEQANRFIKLEPNFFGIGVNLNYLFRRLTGRKE